MFTAREILTMSCFGYYTKIGKHREKPEACPSRLDLPGDLRRLFCVISQDDDGKREGEKRKEGKIGRDKEKGQSERRAVQRNGMNTGGGVGQKT